MLRRFALLVPAMLACSSSEDQQAAAAGAGGQGGGPDCLERCFDDHPKGGPLYETLLACLLCQECYVTCDGAGAGCSEPASAGACDDKPVCDDSGTSAPNADCAGCALAGPCKADLEACQTVTDCVGYAQCIEGCAH